jgi:hypothetical protein
VRADGREFEGLQEVTASPEALIEEESFAQGEIVVARPTPRCRVGRETIIVGFGEGVPRWQFLARSLGRPTGERGGQEAELSSAAGQTPHNWQVGAVAPVVRLGAGRTRRLLLSVWRARTTVARSSLASMSDPVASLPYPDVILGRPEQRSEVSLG